MSNMTNLDFLVPCRKDHAVKEAVLTVFIDAPISDIKSFQELEKHGILNYFKRFEVINQNHFNITLKDNIPNVNAQKLNESGFKYIDYVDGKPSKVFQGINELNRYYFSFHELTYVRWKEFKEMFETCINLLGTHKGKFHVKAYSLHVIDEFSWGDKSAIPYTDIFRENNKIIPTLFHESKGVDYLISRNISDTDTKIANEAVERIQVNGVHNDVILGSKLIISHNYTEIMSDATEALILIQSNEFAEKITSAHKRNKQLVKELLNDKVLEIIHFN